MKSVEEVTGKNRTIVDITQLVHWPGRLTGIPRVMNEISSRYAQQSNTLFVVWDNQAGLFYELDIQQSLNQRGQGIFYRKTDAVTSLEVDTTRRLQDTLVSVLRKTAKKFKKYSPNAYMRIASRVNRQLREGGSVAITPEKDDMLIVLWGEWGDAIYRKALLDAKGRGVSLVNIVYDMLPMLAPQYSGHSTEAMNDFYTQIIPVCDLILSISEYTKRDLIAWLGAQKLNVPKIVTFRLGDDFALSKPSKPEDSQFSEGLKGGSDYILCVGTIEARKNHTILYYAYKLAKARDIKLPKLVIVGRRGWRTDDMFDMICSDPDVKDKFIILSGASDEELSWLYKNSLFTIYPSFYEGWGLPIAESIAYGKPCISSNTSSMPEVAGDLIDYFSPVSSDECLGAITKLLSKKELQKAQARIREYKTTSWNDTYVQFDNSIKELYATKN